MYHSANRLSFVLNDSILSNSGRNPGSLQLSSFAEAKAPSAKQFSNFVNNAFAMGLFNTGLPFIYLKQPHGPILAIADVGILVGGGVSAYRRNPTAVPLFLGLIGLRLWAAVEAKSLASSFQRQPPKDCL